MTAGRSDPEIGVVLPQSELPGDVGEVRYFVEGVERLGYRHLLVYDQVVGSTGQAPGPFGITSVFHEPLVLLAFVAATTSLDLATGVVVLPQRQTALVAKQAAELDVLSGGRLRLGVAVGQNRDEYAALGEDFTTRGRRFEYQVDLLRRLWTRPVNDFSSPREVLRGAGIAPLPVQRPIPLWFGASAPRALLRTGRLADGWFPEMQPGPDYDAALAVIARGAVKTGRDPDEVQVEGRVHWQGSVERVAADIEAWRAVGARYVAVSTLGDGRSTAEAHLALLAATARRLRLYSSGRNPALAD